MEKLWENYIVKYFNLTCAHCQHGRAQVEDGGRPEEDEEGQGVEGEGEEGHQG